MNERMTAERDVIQAREATAKKKGFDQFMTQPTTRMMISMIPAGEKQEVLETLLFETYNAGFNSGVGTTAGNFLEAILTNMEKKRPGPQ